MTEGSGPQQLGNGERARLYVSLALYTVCVIAVIKNLDGLAGAIVGWLAGHWLPPRARGDRRS